MSKMIELVNNLCIGVFTETNSKVTAIELADRAYDHFINEMGFVANPYINDTLNNMKKSDSFIYSGLVGSVYIKRKRYEYKIAYQINNEWKITDDYFLDMDEFNMSYKYQSQPITLGSPYIIQTSKRQRVN